MKYFRENDDGTFTCHTRPEMCFYAIHAGWVLDGQMLDDLDRFWREAVRCDMEDTYWEEFKSSVPGEEEDPPSTPVDAAGEGASQGRGGEEGDVDTFSGRSCWEDHQTLGGDIHSD